MLYFRTEEHTMRNNKKGFTLIEMLAVIAIIAVLVAIIVPAIGSSTEKAKAAADAANLRSVLSLLNIHVVNGDKTVDEIINTCANPTSKMDEDAKLYAVFNAPGFIHVFYVNETTATYYSLDYLSEVATNGPESENLPSTDTPNIPGGDWYKAGVNGKLDVIP